jgi:hypothetical protein
VGRVAAGEAHQVGGHRVGGIGPGPGRHQGQLAKQQREPGRAPGRRLEQKAPLPLGAHGRIGEIAGGEHGELELVVHHVVVLPGLVQPGQHHPRPREQAVRFPPTPRERRAHQRVVHHRVLPDRLAAERLLVAHVAVGAKLAQHASEDMLRHRRGPDRPHHERGHHSVPAEVGGEVGQPRHQLFPAAQQLHAEHLPLEAPGAQGAGRVAGARQPMEELRVEDLLPRERRERRRVGEHPGAEAHPAAASARDRHRVPGGAQAAAQRVGPKLEHHGGAGVERGPHQAHHPLPPLARGGDRGPKPRLQGRERRRVQQRQVPPPLGLGQARDRRHQQRLLPDYERRRGERLQVPAGVDEIPLHPHRAQHRPADRDPGGPRHEGVLDGAEPAGIRHRRVPAVPVERGRAPARVAHGEARALVGGIGPDEHRAAAARLQVDLDGIAPGVPIEPGAIALVGGRVVQARLRKGQHRRHSQGRRLHRERQSQQERRHRWSPQGASRRPEGSTTRS